MTSVYIQKCSEYDSEKVSEAVHRLLEALGGIRQYVKRGQSVLIKPNMLAAKGPEKGITTHPVVLKAMIREVQSAGGNVWIGDSPSGAIKGIPRYWENTGYGKVAEETGARLLNFEAIGTRILEKEGFRFHVARAVLDADRVINMPKFKTHGFTLYTGAVKNLFGTLPGFQKTNFHKRLPHPDDFSRMTAVLYSLIPVSLHVMDGIVGMAGNGPATGSLREVGLLLGSTDGVALDSVASHLMGFRSGEVVAVQHASGLNAGEGDLDRISVEGISLEEERLTDFPLPSNTLIKWVPGGLIRWAARFVWVRPEVNREKCTACEVCVEICPVQAIHMDGDFPVMDYEKCINCLCCNESCPDGAIYQKQSWIARRVG
jgi:uncharacterized protein (DUF362 family)/NAD-dependent dihydropyrimidine dehydrogenase PreA subunit